MAKLKPGELDTFLKLERFSVNKSGPDVDYLTISKSGIVHMGRKKGNKSYGYYVVE